jgi:hypothetical protein
MAVHGQNFDRQENCTVSKPFQDESPGRTMPVLKAIAEIVRMGYI